MTPFLTTLLAISLSMSAVIGLLLFLGPILSRRYRPHWRYWAWLVVAVRLLIPFHLSLPQAPMQLQAPPEDAVLLTHSTPYATVSPAIQSAAATPAVSAPLPVTAAPHAGQTQTPSNRIELPNSEQPAGREPSTPAFTLDGLLTALWALGATGMLLWNLIGLVRFRRFVRRWSAPLSSPEGLSQRDRLCAELHIRRTVPVSLCPGVDSPMLAGLIRPVILLPQQPPQGEDLWYALRHELQHYRRHDIPYKAVLLLANCVHWFNPLVWIMRGAADQDMELCCDAGVVQGLSRQQRSSYGQAILAALNHSPRNKKR